MEPKGFEWDKGNSGKSWRRHRVTDRESEEVFFDRHLLVARDEEHSRGEECHYALGSTFAGRRLFVVYAVRGDRIRVISARDMGRKERREYEKTEADTALQE